MHTLGDKTLLGLFSRMHNSSNACFKSNDIGIGITAQAYRGCEKGQKSSRCVVPRSPEQGLGKLFSPYTPHVVTAIATPEVLGNT